MASDSSRKRLPFEPAGKGKGADKSSKEAAPPTAQAQDGGSKPARVKKAAKVSSRPRAGATEGIPEVVSQRMLRRMLAFSGVPTALGVGVFFVSYFLLIKGIVELPRYFVLLTTLGCFGLGVVGLTYGVLSASWDEDRPGAWLGLDEFKVNFGRMRNAWGSKADS
jgi:hypothetical protein